LPPVSSRHPLWDDPALPETVAEGRYALSVADHGRRETWGSDPVSGQPREIVHLPGNSWWPFVAALVLAVMCIALLTKQYPLAALAAAVTVLLLLRWSWENGAHPKAAPDARTAEGDPPLHSRTFDGPGLWGMAVTLLAHGALYMALLFGWFYLWTVAPQWQLPAGSRVAWPMWLLACVLMVLGWWCFRRRVLRLRDGEDQGLARALWAIAALGLVQCLTLAAAWHG